MSLGPIAQRSREECDPETLGLGPALQEPRVEGGIQAAETAFRHLFRAMSHQMRFARECIAAQHDKEQPSVSAARGRLEVWKQVALMVTDAYGRYQASAQIGEAARKLVPPLLGVLGEEVPPAKEVYQDPDLEFA